MSQLHYLTSDLSTALMDETRAAIGLPPLRRDLSYRPDECSSQPGVGSDNLSSRKFKIDPGGRHGFRSAEQVANFIAAGIANWARWHFGGPRLDLCGARPRKDGKRKHPCRR